ncbi:MAG: GNAT family N-acetyltransferase [Flavobacteriales bacterium]|nr:GNAT family N-acetyltransferase [Flavobacteriales bacterium]
MLEWLYSTAALEQAMNAKGQLFLVAEQDGGTIGFAGFTPNKKVEGTTHLDKLYVLPSLKGSGLGKALLDNVIIETKRAGNSVLELNVNKRNKAIGFYEHMGFRIVREEVIDIGKGYVMDDFVMGRVLP